MTSPGGKLTACHPTKEENKAEELTNLYKNWSNQGILKGGSITVLLTSCLTWFGLVCLAYRNKKKFSCHTADSKPVKQEVNSTVILPPLVFPGLTVRWQVKRLTLPMKFSNQRFDSLSRYLHPPQVGVRGNQRLEKIKKPFLQFLN